MPPLNLSPRVFHLFLLQQLSLYLFLYREIWARFLAFESNIGDLASILKVEKRRFTAFKEEYEGKETALLVDRYKFMDLYPCSASELKALGYKVRTFNCSAVFFSPSTLSPCFGLAVRCLPLTEERVRQAWYASPSLPRRAAKCQAL